MNKDISTHQGKISGTIPVGSATTWINKAGFLKKSGNKVKTKLVVRPYSGISTVKALAVLIIRFMSIVYNSVYNKFCSLTGISKTKK